MPFRAILFDLDGTLLDTLQDIADSVNAVLSRHGYQQHDLDAYRYLVGDGTIELARRALPEQHRTEAAIIKAVSEVNEEYNKRWMNNTHIYEGIPELLDAASRFEIKMCILSNKSQEFTELSVGRFLSRWNFEIVMGARKGIPLKPDPTAALRIAKELNIIPADFLYLGDTATDMKTAIAAGMYAVGALWGFRTAEELKQSGAKIMAASPLEILDLIGS